MATIVEIFNSEFGVIGLLALVLVCCAVTYWLARHSLAHELQEVKDQLAIVSEVKSAVQELARMKGKPAEQPKQAPAVETEKAPIQAPALVPADELAHETLVVIAASVAAFLGKSVRLRSARLIQPMADSPWAQQGRVYVQASHNLGVAQRAHS